VEGSATCATFTALPLRSACLEGERRGDCNRCAVKLADQRVNSNFV
jgi:hypothetical protein